MTHSPAPDPSLPEVLVAALADLHGGTLPSSLAVPTATMDAVTAWAVDELVVEVPCGTVRHQMRVEPHRFRATPLLPPEGTPEREAIDGEHLVQSFDPAGPQCVQAWQRLRGSAGGHPTLGNVSVRTVVRAVQYHDAGIVFDHRVEGPLRFGVNAELAEELISRIDGTLSVVNTFITTAGWDEPLMTHAAVWAACHYEKWRAPREVSETVHEVTNEMTYTLGRRLATQRPA